MQFLESEGPEDVIRITRDEAMSGHVEDLLIRQKSLRGESGVSRDRSRRWYYQNWFVFLIVGSCSAFAAWAVLEPYFDDMSHLQGVVQDVNLDETLASQLINVPVKGRGWITVGQQRVWMLDLTKAKAEDGEWIPLDLKKLKRGQEVRVYVEDIPLVDSNGNIVDRLALCLFVDFSPSALPPGRSTETLAQQESRRSITGLLLFAVVGGFIGLGVGAVDGLVCRLWWRAVLAGGVGLLVGFLGGFVSGILANLLYAPLNAWAMSQTGGSIENLSVFGFLIQLMGRSLAWGLAGMTMGLGQGLALRSKRLFLYGLLGGIIGGLLGGLLFDPVDLIILGPNKPSSHWSRLIGIVCVGGTVGLMIGLVELLARDAWLRMTAGPLAGKEFLVFKDVMKIGSSPRSDIYLFNDPEVASHHAILRSVGNECQLENLSRETPTRVNDSPCTKTRLRHGDVIAMGKTVLVFQQKKA